jgi:hypothetical protein
MEDAILVHFTPEGESVNSQNYYEAHDQKSDVVQNWLETKPRNFFLT